MPLVWGLNWIAIHGFIPKSKSKKVIRFAPRSWSRSNSGYLCSLFFVGTLCKSAIHGGPLFGSPLTSLVDLPCEPNHMRLPAAQAESFLGSKLHILWFFLCCWQGIRDSCVYKFADFQLFYWISLVYKSPLA